VRRRQRLVGPLDRRHPGFILPYHLRHGKERAQGDEADKSKETTRRRSQNPAVPFYVRLRLSMDCHDPSSPFFRRWPITV